MNGLEWHPYISTSMLPPYYSSLEPFHETFRSGLPILTYHKLGARPPRVRLKGMYLSQGLFGKQMCELRDAGFRSVSLSDVLRAPSEITKGITLTFDDGFQNVLDHGLHPLAECSYRAIQFLLPDLLGGFNEWEQAEGEAPERLMDAAAVRDWLQMRQ